MEKYLRVGVITSPHGVRGEVKVYPTTDDVMRFKKLDKVILQRRPRHRSPWLPAVQGSTPTPSC